MTVPTSYGAPDIRCSRCGTLTTWNPYCPTCGAYLEFAGVPPWEPGQKFNPAPPPATAESAPVEIAGEHSHSARHLWLHHGDKAEPDSANPTAQRPSQVLTPGAGMGGAGPESRVVAPVALTSPVAEMPGVAVVPSQRTSAMVMHESKEAAGGPVCERCHHRNAVWRAYCERCGLVLPNAVLGPKPEHLTNAGGARGRQSASGKGPHRSTWWKKVIAAMVAFTLIYGIWYLFFGPDGAETRALLTVQGQKLWVLINPSGGVSAPVQTVVASSSLPGTLPTSLTDPASRTFWASAPSEDFGAGTTITITFTTPVEIDRLFVYPGIQNGQLDIRSLATPQEVTLEFSPTQKITSTLVVADGQDAYKQLITFPTVKTSTVTLSINSVYPPLYADPSQTVGEVAISALDFLQVPSLHTAIGGVMPTEVIPSGAPTALPTDAPTNVPTS